MNRLAKGFRVTSGITILLNIIIIFVPQVLEIASGYKDELWSEFITVLKMGSRDMSPVGTNVYAVVGLMIFPLFLAIGIGIWELASSEKNVISSYFSMAVLFMYVFEFIYVAKQCETNTSLALGIADHLHILLSFIGVIFAFLSVFLLTKDESVLEEAGITDLYEFNQKIATKYNVVERHELEATSNSVLSGDSDSFDFGEDKTLELTIVSEELTEVLTEPAFTAPRGVMVGLEGVYAGAEIPFADGETIKLGRQGNNDLVFANQEKVSRNHCYIKWDAGIGKFILCDYSSNGTFADGAEDCIPQNLEIMINPGTLIAIGDEQNTFRLE